MKLLQAEAENIELDKVHIHIVLEGMNEALKFAQKLHDLIGAVVDIKADKHREKRSLNANNYFYKLVGELAAKHGNTKDEMHDREICRYGQYLLDKNENIVWCLIPADADTSEVDAILKPTGRTEDRNGVLYTWYAVMKPTHLYDTKEMAVLLDGVISDCKEDGIEVLSPDEIERMKASYSREMGQSG